MFRHAFIICISLLIVLAAGNAPAQGLAPTSWPVTRQDGATTGRSPVATAAYGVPDWTAAIPIGGVTHGGICILPSGDLVWKAYDQAAVGGVYRFDVTTKTITWDSPTSAGLNTGIWGHGGVAVGVDGLYFGSRDGTYSVGNVNYDGTLGWSMTVSGAELQVRGTPLLNPSLNRLYVRDAGDSGILYCIDTTNGNEIWSFDMRAVVDPGVNFYSSFGMLTGWGTGAAGDMYLYNNSNDSDESIVVRDDGASASAVWFHNAANPGWQFTWHGSQLYNDGYLYASTFADGGRDSFYKIDATTGAIVWSLNLSDGAANHFCRPAMSPDGQTFYVGGHGGTVTAYQDNGATGAVRWQYASTLGTAEFNQYVSVAGTVGDTWIYAIGNDILLYAFHDDGVQTSPYLVWTYQLAPAEYFGSMQVAIDADGGLYVAGGSGNAEDGNFVLYHFPPAAPGDVDGNGVVNGLDLTAVLTAWDTIPGDLLWNVYADLDTNQVVNGLDLTEVISNWTISSSSAPEEAEAAKPGKRLGNVRKGR
jgi:outer membrane protein assembly factor BamB